MEFIFQIRTGFPGGLVVKYLPDNVGDGVVASLNPGSGRSLGGGNDNPLQYSCPENFMDRGTWWAPVHGVTESNMTDQLSNCALIHTYTHKSLNLQNVN